MSLHHPVGARAAHQDARPSLQKSHPGSLRHAITVARRGSKLQSHGMAHLYLWNDGKDSGEPGVGDGPIKDGGRNMPVGIFIFCD